MVYFNVKKSWNIHNWMIWGYPDLRKPWYMKIHKTVQPTPLSVASVMMRSCSNSYWVRDGLCHRGIFWCLCPGVWQNSTGAIRGGAASAYHHRISTLFWGVLICEDSERTTERSAMEEPRCPSCQRHTMTRNIFLAFELGFVLLNRQPAEERVVEDRDAQEESQNSLT
jgi:hypothetical protein